LATKWGEAFKNQQKFYSHRSQIGHMIEVLYENKFYIAHIVELLNEHYFKVKLHLVEDIYLYFTPTSQYIFPFKWCELNSLALELPVDWCKDKCFNWDEYISLCNKNKTVFEDFLFVGADQSLFSSIIARHLTNICEKYKLGSYLECVNPLNLDEICIGQIRLRVRHLLFIKIYSNSEQNLFIFTQNSFDLFPIGWSEMNNYKNFVLPIEFQNFCVDKSYFRSDIEKIPYLVKFNGNFVMATLY
jgi:hypothetical protein